MTTEREVRKKLAEAGWTFEEGTNHTLAVSPDWKKKIPIWRHKGRDIPTGTLVSIQRESGIKMK